MNSALKSLRGKKMMTQEEVALKLKVSRQTYTNYENEVSKLSLKLISKILIALNANEEEINQFFYDIKQDIMSR